MDPDPVVDQEWQDDLDEEEDNDLDGD